MSVVEKIKQKQVILWYATGRKSVHNSACAELEQGKPMVLVDDVLKILEGKTVVEKQKLEELLKEFPKKNLGSEGWFIDLAIWKQKLESVFGVESAKKENTKQ